MIRKAVLGFFNTLLVQPDSRFLFFLNNIRILRKYNSVFLMLYVYDSMREMDINRMLRWRLKRLVVRWSVFRAHKPKYTGNQNVSSVYWAPVRWFWRKRFFSKFKFKLNTFGLSNISSFKKFLYLSYVTLRRKSAFVDFSFKRLSSVLISVISRHNNRKGTKLLKKNKSNTLLKSYIIAGPRKVSCVKLFYLLLSKSKNNRISKEARGLFSFMTFNLALYYSISSYISKNNEIFQLLSKYMSRFSFYYNFQPNESILSVASGTYTGDLSTDIFQLERLRYSKLLSVTNKLFFSIKLLLAKRFKNNVFPTKRLLFLVKSALSLKKSINGFFDLLFYKKVGLHKIMYKSKHVLSNYRKSPNKLKTKQVNPQFAKKIKVNSHASSFNSFSKKHLKFLDKKVNLLENSSFLYNKYLRSYKLTCEFLNQGPIPFNCFFGKLLSVNNLVLYKQFSSFLGFSRKNNKKSLYTSLLHAVSADKDFFVSGSYLRGSAVDSSFINFNSKVSSLLTILNLYNQFFFNMCKFKVDSVKNNFYKRSFSEEIHKSSFMFFTKKVSQGLPIKSYFVIKSSKIFGRNFFTKNNKNLYKSTGSLKISNVFANSSGLLSRVRLFINLKFYKYKRIIGLLSYLQRVLSSYVLLRKLKRVRFSVVRAVTSVGINRPLVSKMLSLFFKVRFLFLKTRKSRMVFNYSYFSRVLKRVSNSVIVYSGVRFDFDAFNTKLLISSKGRVETDELKNTLLSRFRSSFNKFSLIPGVSNFNKKKRFRHSFKDTRAGGASDIVSSKSVMSFENLKVAFRKRYCFNSNLNFRNVLKHSLVSEDSADNSHVINVYKSWKSLKKTKRKQQHTFFKKSFSRYSFLRSKLYYPKLKFDQQQRFLQIIRSFFLYRVRQALKSFWLFLKYTLSNVLEGLGVNINPENILVVGLNQQTISAAFIGSFIKYHLEKKFYIFHILNLV